jgi:PAS domain S-box-containing protein
MEIDTSVLHKDGLFTAILKTVSDGITVIDKDLKILFQNEAIYRIYGHQIGQYCYKAYRGLNEPCEDCVILEVIKDGKPRKGLRDVHLPGGNVIWLEFFSGPYNDPEGNIIGAVEVIRDVTEQVRITKECFTLRREMERQAKFENIITQSKQMKAIFRLIERVASTNSSVLITGESGTGKELIAKAILFNSNRKDNPYVTVNCGAIPENLLESELFGHVKGAFTGAVRDHSGLIQTADGGTLFLDEVGEIPLSLQVKLLRFLQEGESRRVGDTVTKKFDVRILSATNRNLEDSVKKGDFREDLFFRLSVIPIFIPPLRERKEDIPMLANHLLQNLCDTHKRTVPGISSAALKILMDYSWPGNVRELENTIEYALHLTDEGHPIGVEQLPAKVSGNAGSIGDRLSLVSIDDYTRQTILSLQGNHAEEDIARILGISRKSLWEKRKRWEIPRSKSRV